MNLPQPSTLTAAIRSRILAIPSWVLMIEVFIGAGWLRAFAQKALSLDWWRGDTLATFLVETDEARVPWFHLVTDLVVAPNLALVSAAVALAQLGVGLALVTGRFRVPALLAGLVLNVSFVLAGAVTPSAFYLVAQLAVLLWVIESRRSAWTSALTSILSLGGLALAGSSVLSISSLHPDHVIEDPSMMLVFLGTLTAFVAERARRNRASASTPMETSPPPALVG
ncbi:MAG: hypothetical protein AAGA37_06055 [Actinomycetota bacterium]